MANIVFTGNAHSPNGTKTIRSEVEALAKKNGHAIQRSVGRNTDYLVATRTDTVKAEKAREFGTHVIGYDEFYSLLKTGNIHDKSVPLASIEPLDFTDCEDQEGWGIF